MSFNNNNSDIQTLDGKFKKLDIISEDWTVVDKSNNRDTNSSQISEYPEGATNSHSTTISQQLRPYVPFTVEELSCTTRLDTWSNRNVRVIGYLHLNDRKYNLESINEAGGPYKVLLTFECMTTFPSANQVIQAFGEIKIIQDNNNSKPFINVLFYRSLEVTDLPMYTEVLERMRQYIPLFLNTSSTSESDNDSLYYYYHGVNDCNYFDDNKEDTDDETGIYSNDDFNCVYNTDNV